MTQFDSSHSGTDAASSQQMVPTDGGGPEARPLADYAPPEFCPYCGAQLNPLFYFCLRCATPFKHVEQVIPPHRPRRLSGEELVQLKAPNVWPLFWAYLGVILFINIFALLVVPEGEPQFALFFADLVIIITTAIFAAIYWQSLRVQLTRFGFFNAYAWAAILVGLPVVLGLNYLWHEIVFQWLAGADEWGEDWIGDLRNNMGWFTMLLTFCIVPAITEEIAFRGLMQHWLGVAIKPMHAILLASVLFAALHFSLYSFPVLFLVGMLLGWTKMKTRSLYPSMLIHFLHNWIVIQTF